MSKKFLDKIQAAPPPPPKKFLAQDQKRFLFNEITTLLNNMRGHLMGEVVETAAIRVVEDQRRTFRIKTKEYRHAILGVKLAAKKLRDLIDTLDAQGIEVGLLSNRGGRVGLTGEIEVIEPDQYTITRRLKSVGKERFAEAEKELRMIRGKIYLTPQEDGFKLLEEAQAVVDKYCKATTTKEGLRKLKRLPDEEDE